MDYYPQIWQATLSWSIWRRYSPLFLLSPWRLFHLSFFFFCPSPLPFDGSTVLSLTRRQAGNRTTTSSLSATSRTPRYQLSHEDDCFTSPFFVWLLATFLRSCLVGLLSFECTPFSYSACFRCVGARVNRPALLIGLLCLCLARRCGLVWAFSRGCPMVLRVCLGLWRVLFVYPCFWGFLGVCFFWWWLHYGLLAWNSSLLLASQSADGHAFTLAAQFATCNWTCWTTWRKPWRRWTKKMESVVCISLYCSVCFSCFVWLLPIGSVPPCSVSPLSSRLVPWSFLVQSVFCWSILRVSGCISSDGVKGGSGSPEGEYFSAGKKSTWTTPAIWCRGQSPTQGRSLCCHEEKWR